MHQVGSSACGMRDGVVRRSLPGLCALTCQGEEGSCNTTDMGTFRPVRNYGIRGRAGCLATCASCARCNFASWSAARSECAWFNDCDVSALLRLDDSFETVPMPKAALASPSPAVHRLRPRPPKNVSASLPPYEEVERGLKRTHPSLSRHYGDAWLPPQALDRGVSHARRRRASACVTASSPPRGQSVLTAASPPRRAAPCHRRASPRIAPQPPPRVLRSCRVETGGDGRLTGRIDHLRPAVWDPHRR